AASIQDVRQVKSISAFECNKKGTENMEVFINSLGGFTTLCVVDFSLLLVNLCSISPTFTTISSPCAFIGNHSPLRVSTSKPSALAPINKVIKLISSCAPALTAPAGKLSGFSIGK